jgi:hypothetical protein
MAPSASGERATCQRQGNAAQQERPPHVAGDHRAAAIPAVDEGAGGQPQQQICHRAQRPRQPGLRRRVGDAQDQERQRQVRGALAQRRDGLASPQQQVASIAPERRRGCGWPHLRHRVFVCCHEHILSSEGQHAAAITAHVDPRKLAKERKEIPGAVGRADVDGRRERTRAEERWRPGGHTITTLAHGSERRRAHGCSGGAILRRASTDAGLTRQKQEAVWRHF